MYKPIQTCLRNQRITNDIIPVLDGQLGCYDESFLAVTVIDELFEVILLLSLEFFHPEVIEDEQVCPCKSVKELDRLSL